MPKIKNITAWRLLGIAYVISITYLFRTELDRMGLYQAMWSIAVTSLIVTSMSIFFIKLSDFLIACISVWMVMWKGNVESIDSVGLPIYYVFVVSTTLMGVCLSATFQNSMRQVLIARDEYQNLSETDSLTQAPNRRALIAKIETLRSRNDLAKLWFGMIDLDNFKSINDKHGHDTGDKVLISFSSLIKQMENLVCFGRLGGEEFGVILLSKDIESSAKSLYELMNKAEKDKSAGIEYSFSGGLTELNSTSSVSEILKQADKNLYHAKELGKKCIAYRGRALLRNV